jgi:hypothetical protein
MQRLLVIVLALLAPAAIVSAQADPSVIRSRPLLLDDAALAPLQAGQRFTIELFDGRAVTAVAERSTGPDSWSGRIEGSAPGRFTLVHRNGVLSAIVRVPFVGTFRVRSADGGHVLQEIDENAAAPCEAIPGPEPGPQRAVAAIYPSCDEDGTEIDLLVLYTPAARDDMGSAAAIEAEAALAVANANDAYANSGIDLQLNLVHIQETDYDESGDYSGHLGALAGTEDGTMDEAHGLRYHHSADMVALLVADGQYCGMAYLLQNLAPETEGIMFSVTTWYCAAGWLTLAHELGHNMGCCHAPGDGGGCVNGGIYSYSVGYRYYGDSGTQWRTVMAYAPGSRIPHFSNPEVWFDGEPTGIAPGQPDEADNALTINQTRGLIANFRCGLPYCAVEQRFAPDGGPNDSYGYAVSIDGSRAVVGAFLDDAAAADAGSAYVLRRDAQTGAWAQAAKLLSGDAEAEDYFGSAVALGGDIAVVGATGEDAGGDHAGAAYVYRYNPNNGSWEQHEKLLASDASADAYFGSSVAVDGDVIVVGAAQDGAYGAAYVFRLSGGTWVQETKLTPPGAPGHESFGSAVDVRGDVVAVGAPSQASVNLAGSVFVYRHAGGGSWPLADELEPTGGSVYDGFGTSVAVTPGAVAVGAPSDDVNGQNSGAAYVFGDDGGSWSLRQKLDDPQGASGDAFGSAVDIDGPLAIVGVTGSNDYGTSSGSAFVFRDDDGAWPLVGKLLGPDQEPYNLFGLSVSVDGTTAVVGSLANAGQGSVYIFDGFSGRDCNDNGVQDDCEILAGDADDINGNGVPDECDTPGDLDGDGSVGVTDFLILLTTWGPCPGACPPACAGDLDGDCDVGVGDFLLLLSLWG